VKFFQVIIVLTLVVGLARDFIIHSNPDDLVNIVYSLFAVELAVDFVLRLLNTRSFNWNYKISPLYSLSAIFLFVIFGLCITLLMLGTNYIYQLELNPILLLTIPFWSLGKFLNQAFILNELFVMAAMIDFLRALGLVFAVAWLSYELASFTVATYSLISLFIFFIFVRVNDVGYKTTLETLKTVLLVDFKILIQGILITIIYIFDKSILNLDNSETLFLILLLKICFILNSLLNRGYLHPFHVKLTNKKLCNDSINAVKRLTAIYSALSGFGVWVFFTCVIRFLPLDLTLSPLAIALASFFTILFVFREYSIRMLILEHKTSKLGNLGILYALCLAALLGFFPSVGLEAYLIANIIFLMAYIMLTKTLSKYA